MNQRELAQKIGVHERTIRKWSPAKREQWQALAATKATTYDAAYFDLFNQLAFNVAAFNAASDSFTALLDISKGSNFYIFQRVSDIELTTEFMLPLYKANDIATALSELEKYA